MKREGNKGFGKVEAPKGFPLRAVVTDGVLTISIGIETLAFAFQESEANGSCDNAAGDWAYRWRVADKAEFAKDVCRQLNDESEDGSTPLTRFLDKTMQDAADQGSLGIEEV